VPLATDDHVAGGDLLAHRTGEHVGPGHDGAAEKYGDIRAGSRGGLHRITRQGGDVAASAEPHQGVDAIDGPFIHHPTTLRPGSPALTAASHRNAV